MLRGYRIDWRRFSGRTEITCLVNGLVSQECEGVCVFVREGNSELAWSCSGGRQVTQFETCRFVQAPRGLRIESLESSGRVLERTQAPRAA